MAKGGRFTYIEYQGEDAARVLASMVSGGAVPVTPPTPPTPTEEKPREKAGFVVHIPDLDIDTDTEITESGEETDGTDPD